MCSGQSQQQIADKLNVARTTVLNDLRDVNVKNDIEAPETVTNSRGQERPTTYQREAPANVNTAHGEWLPMLRQIGISQQDASRYMRIASDLKSPNFGDLPPSPSALLVIASLTPEAIESGIERGNIHPGMTMALLPTLRVPLQAVLSPLS